MMNTVEFNGRTYTRKGREYSHAVVTTSAVTDAVLVEWASTYELAHRNLSSHLARAAKVADGTRLSGVFSNDYYEPENFHGSIILPVTH